MKANELMIGDWVQDHPFGEGRVTAILARDELVMYYRNYCYTTTCLSNISPIPLTAEILEKNAYPYDGSWYSFGDFYVAHYGDCYVIHQNPNDDKREFLCRINYVHELQHALRLCGLNDLADDFVV